MGVKNIFLTEDDADDREFFTEALKDINVTINCEVAHNGKEAIQKLKDSPNLPDLIFLDLNMPKIDGWEFLNKMKEKSLVNTVYILTSSTSELDLHKSKHYNNVKDFLIKPINTNVLKAILDNLI